jgi:dTDP-4-amino-4,6-dideoxygalactose transaminase
MHPFAAAVGRLQLRNLDAHIDLVRKNVRSQNDPLIQLPGLREPRVRPDQIRSYYNANMLLLDPVKAGFSRDALVEALKAEGVGVSTWHDLFGSSVVAPPRHHSHLHARE